jgi:nicotinamidase-related amidase
MTGVSTNTCVETTARDASDRGFESILVEDACASFDEASHVATLRIFARMFGEVLTTDEVLARMEGRPAKRMESSN